MISDTIERLRIGVVILCCLFLTVSGGAAHDTGRILGAEIEPEIESRSERTEEQPQSRQAQRTNATPSANTADNRIRIDVATNGSATWTVQYRVRLDDANETAAFDALRADITASPATYRERFSQRLTDVVANAEVTTGREMAIENVGVNATQEGDIGIVVYTFEWRNFAATNSERIRIGDALTGFFLETGTRLTIGWAAGYEPTTVKPAPDERQPTEVTWTASGGFDDSEPVVELRRNSSASADGSNAEESSGRSDSVEGGDLPVASLLVGVLVVFGSSAALLWVRQRRRDDSTEAHAYSDEPGADSDGNGERTPEANIAANARSDESQGGGETSYADMGLLSNEERVVEVLRQSGGRAKQQRVVKELEWTDAKTSQVVNKLREDGTIEGFRLGRENVLILPEKVPNDDENDYQHQ